MENRIFISYSGVTSKNVALELKNAFETASDGQIKCFVASEDLPIGTDWKSKIKAELDDCALVVFCLTKENINSPWLTFEIGATIASGTPILPLLINCDFDDLKDSPLRSYQSFRVKLFEDSSRRKLASEIINILNLDEKTKNKFTVNFPNQLRKVREKNSGAKYDHYISTLEEYIQVISLIDVDADGKSNKKISNRQANIFYRGQTHRKKQIKGEIINLDPMPSVFRKDVKYGEQEIYNQIMTECAHEFADCISHCETLAKMQHYGTPTRLLDITTNALAALFFACVDENGKTDNKSEGVVFVIQSDDKHIKVFDSDTITVLSSLPRFSDLDKDGIRTRAHDSLVNKDPIDYFHKGGESDAVLRLLHEVRKEKPAFEPKIKPKDVLSNFIFTPQKTNARIIRQSGAFVIFGLGSTKLPCNGDEAEFDGEPKVIAEIHIRKKEDIKRTLEKCGISLAAMYPELYKVSQYVSGKVFDD